jgi:hypothetical protein
MSRVRRAVAGRDGLAQVAVVLGAVGVYEVARILGIGFVAAALLDRRRREEEGAQEPCYT